MASSPPREGEQDEGMAAAAAAAVGPTPPQQQQQPRRRHAVELVPPAEMAAAMRVDDESGGLVAPEGPPAIAVAGGGGGAHQPLPRQLRARLAHEEPQRGVPPGRGEDPHAPRHLPVAQAQPLAPVVLGSMGARGELVQGADEEVAAAHGRGKHERGQHAARDEMGGRRDKHVESAAVGPAARGVTQRWESGRQGPAPQ